MGQTADSIKTFAFGTLLLLYYNQVLGVSGTLTGIAVAIAIGFDAISDPAVGSWSDGFRHRLGRRHPFMFAAIVPLAGTFFLLFWPPQGLSEFGLFIWLTVFAVLTRTALTFFQVPFIALGAEITKDYQERTQIAALRQATGLVGSLIVVGLTWNVIMLATEEQATPQLTREPYFEFAVMASLVMAVFMLICCLGTRRFIGQLSTVDQDHPPFSLTKVYRDIYSALKNPSFFALFWGSLVFVIFVGVHGSLSMHTKTYFWQLETWGIEYIQYGAALGGVTGLALIGTFHKWFDKRATLLMGVANYLTCQTVPIALQMLGLMPTSVDTLTWTLIALQVVGYAGIMHAVVSGLSMMGDITDEHELQHGLRQEGIYFGSFNFAVKCTTAFGSMIAGFGLDLVGFPDSAIPGEVATEVLFNYGLFSVALVGMALLGIYIFWPYSLNRERHATILSQLSRRAADNPAR